MKNNWFCPNCGQPMEAQRHVDNPTGRITWTIGCLNPKHFHTRGYMVFTDRPLPFVLVLTAIKEYVQYVV